MKLVRALDSNGEIVKQLQCERGYDTDNLSGYGVPARIWAQERPQTVSWASETVSVFYVSL